MFNPEFSSNKKLLLAKGVSKPAPAISFSSMLIAAATRRLTDLGQLIEEGGNVNHQDENGNTLLHHIFGYLMSREDGGKDYNTIEWLLAHGADPKLKDSKGVSCIHFIKNFHYTNTSRYFNGDRIKLEVINKFFNLVCIYQPTFDNFIFFIASGFMDFNYKNVSYLSVECLKRLKGWCENQLNIIKSGSLSSSEIRFDNSSNLFYYRKEIVIHNLEEIIKTIDGKINLQTDYPYLSDALRSVLHTNNRRSVLRCMLIGSPLGKLIIDVINVIDTISLDDDIITQLKQLSNDYESRRQILEEMKAIPEPLDKNEAKIVDNLYANLDLAFNYQIMLRGQGKVGTKLSTYEMVMNGLVSNRMAIRKELLSNDNPKRCAVFADIVKCEGSLTQMRQLQLQGLYKVNKTKLKIADDMTDTPKKLLTIR